MGVHKILRNFLFHRGTKLDHYEVVSGPTGFKINVDNTVNMCFLSDCNQGRNLIQWLATVFSQHYCFK